MPRLPLEPMEKNLVFLPLLAIDGALIVSRLLQPAHLRASAVGMKNLRSTASGFRAPRASGVPHASLGERLINDSGASRREGVNVCLPSLRGAKRRSNPYFLCGKMDCFASLAMTVGWIASRSLSSGAHSRDPLARNDGRDLSSPQNNKAGRRRRCSSTRRRDHYSGSATPTRKGAAE